MVELATKFTIPIPIIDFHGSIKPWKWEFKLEDKYPFGFLTGNMSQTEIQQSLDDVEKPVSELIADEMSKMQANIEADKAAKEATDIAKQLQQKQIENLLAN